MPFSYLNDSRGAHVPSRRASKDETISFDMKVTQTIWHHKDRRSISLLRRRLFSFLVGLNSIIAGAASGSDFCLIPELDLAKKSFRVTSFMSTNISSIVTIRLGNDGISSRRQDKEIRDHGRRFGPSFGYFTHAVQKKSSDEPNPSASSSCFAHCSAGAAKSESSESVVCLEVLLSETMTF
jgi:hypothetical protein